MSKKNQEEYEGTLEFIGFTKEVKNRAMKIGLLQMQIHNLELKGGKEEEINTRRKLSEDLLNEE